MTSETLQSRNFWGEVLDPWCDLLLPIVCKHPYSTEKCVLVLLIDRQRNYSHTRLTKPTFACKTYLQMGSLWISKVYFENVPFRTIHFNLFDCSTKRSLCDPTPKGHCLEFKNSKKAVLTHQRSGLMWRKITITLKRFPEEGDWKNSPKISQIRAVAMI